MAYGFLSVKKFSVLHKTTGKSDGCHELRQIRNLNSTTDIELFQLNRPQQAKTAGFARRWNSFMI
jgi:hypothetical protein